MKTSSSYFTMLLTIGGLLSGATNAAAFEFDILTTVTVADDSYDVSYQVGDTITGTFIVDDDTANGGPGSDPGPGTNPGHEYTSFWEFNGAPYSVNLQNVREGTSFSSGTQAVVVNDGLTITADDTGGMIPDGTYDWIEILGATTSDYCPLAGGDCSGDPNSILVADGEEWTLAIFATDDTWFTGGDIPQTLPESYTAFLIGSEFDAMGNEIGVVLAPVDTLTGTAVPPDAPKSSGCHVIGSSRGDGKGELFICGLLLLAILRWRVASFAFSPPRVFRDSNDPSHHDPKHTGHPTTLTVLGTSSGA